VRLVREILLADAEPGVVEGDALARARRFLQVVTEGLGLRAGGLFLRAMATGQLDCAASTLPASVSRHLTDPGGRLGTLARRAVDERRAFVLRRTSEEPLVQELREADPAIETVAMVPLVDRTPTGILVIAGSEAALAPEIIRTLNPGLRLLAVLVSPLRDGARVDTVDPGELEAVRIERDGYARQIIELQGRITDLESAVEVARSTPPTGTLAGMVEVVEPATPPEIAARIPRPMPAPSGSAVGAMPLPSAAAGGAPAAEDPNAEKVLVVIDTTSGWERHEVHGHRIVALAPATDLAARVRALAPNRLIVNAIAPGALPALIALRAEGVLVRATGVLVEPGADRVVGLGAFEAVGHPLVIDALVAAVMRSAPRNARIFAAGRDADALMKVRQALVKAGHSVSMARDTKQIDELVAMVRPHLIISDLELPVREGFELVMRAAATVPPPGLVLIVPAGGDPSAVLAEKLRDRLAAGLGSTAARWLADVTTDPSAKGAQKPVPKTVAGAR
jgi:CheY-like chemotaxis protein